MLASNCLSFYVQAFYEFEISDHATVGQFVGKVLATDSDTADRSALIYSIPHENIPLEINSTSGTFVLFFIFLFVNNIS